MMLEFETVEIEIPQEKRALGGDLVDCLTQCPYKKKIKVGSIRCMECDHRAGIWNNKVFCNYEANQKMKIGQPKIY